MKPVFVISLFFIVIVVLFPLILRGRTEEEAGASAGESPEPVYGLWMEGRRNDEADEQEGMKPFDETAEVTLISDDGSFEILTMRDYLTGVVAAEMPASFELEALKAQAVAARTYTLYRMTEERAHEGGALCTDPGCCNAYIDRAALKEKWGEDFDKNLARITRAVGETDGICVSYRGRPIFAAFHSSSAGRTEDSENVWKSELPYLRSVPSPEKAEEVPDYTCDVTISFNEIRGLVKEALPEAALGEDPKDWLSGAVYTENGRLARVSLGGMEIRGTELRRLFGLRSASVSWSVEKDGIRFETRGYGHGVGLSQYGANAMAKAGADYAEILDHYYTGVDIAVVSASPGPEDGT